MQGKSTLINYITVKHLCPTGNPHITVLTTNTHKHTQLNYTPIHTQFTETNVSVLHVNNELNKQSIKLYIKYQVHSMSTV